MPRYYFHVFDGTDVPDRDGSELPDLSAARQNALKYASSILSDQSFSQALGEDWHMEVTDAKGLIYFRLDFHLTDAPIARNDKGKSAR